MEWWSVNKLVHLILQESKVEDLTLMIEVSNDNKTGFKKASRRINPD